LRVSPPREAMITRLSPSRAATSGVRRSCPVFAPIASTMTTGRIIVVDSRPREIRIRMRSIFGATLHTTTRRTRGRDTDGEPCQAGRSIARV